MELTLIQLATFLAFQLVILSTAVGATVAAYRKSRQEPRAEWASALRESIATDLEGFRAQIQTLKALPTDLADLKSQEERHHASHSKLIRDLAAADEDDEDIPPLFERPSRTPQEVLNALRLATQQRGGDLTDEPIAGLRQNGNISADG